VAARLVVAPGWHINANPATYDYLIPTTLQVTSDLPVDVTSVSYPPARVFQPAFAEDSLSVYTDTTVVQAVVRLAADADPASIDGLSLRLLFQACDDAQCLAPAQITLPLHPVAADAGVFARKSPPQ